METIQDKLRRLPELPGIYLMKDTHGAIFYVGKAKNLKNRVRSYFQHNNQHSKKVQRMVWNIADLEWRVVDTELDALLLECRLIQEHHPLYNRVMNHHRNYAYIHLTKNGAELLQEKLPPDSEVSPATFQLSDAQAKSPSIVGPFRQYKQLPHLLEALQDTYLLPGINHLTELAVKRQLPDMAQQQLTDRVYQVHLFFQGEPTAFFDDLQARIAASAQQLNFENAAELQHLLEMAQHFHRYLKQRASFRKQTAVLFSLPLADGKTKKLYLVSCGQLLATQLLPLEAPETFDLKPLSTPPPLTKSAVDPEDILMNYIMRATAENN